MTAARILKRTAALALLPLLVVLVWRFPVGVAPLTGMLAIYAGCLLRWPNAWLFAVPALLPVLDLAPWSGRFFLDAYDLLLLTTLVAVWAKGTAHGSSSSSPGARLAVWLLVASCLVSTVIGLWPFPPVDNPNAFSSYLSHYNALRVAKGFAWAVLLWSPLETSMRSSPVQSRRLLLAGLLTGLVFLGLIVLWERGVLRAIVEWRTMYSALAALLDFSSQYRVTGLFSGMHVGGSAIDGYLALVLPFAVVAVLTERLTALRLLAGIALAAGVYALMVTFSRAAYAAFAVSMAFLGLLAFRHIHVKRVVQPMGIVYTGAVIALSTLALLGLYQTGGYQALCGGLMAIAGGVAADRILRSRHVAISWLVVAAVAIITALLIREALMDSKWHGSSNLVATGIGVSCGLGFPLIAMWVSRRHLNILPTDQLFTAVAAVVVTWFLAVPALAGYRMESRLASVSEDVPTRTSHWRDTIDISEPTLVNRAFGMGVGSFPRRYFYHYLGAKDLASYLFVNDGQTYLALGSGRFDLMQRIDLDPDTTYLVTIKARAKSDNSSLRLDFCLKNLIYSQRWQPDCIKKQLHLDGAGHWQTFEWIFDSGDLGRSPLLDWPVNVIVSNRAGPEVVDVARIAVLDPEGVDLIANGDFSAGSDRWFLVSDFAHLAWHAKSLLLHVWFEQGWFGVLALMLFLAACAAGFRRRLIHGDALAAAALGGLLATFAVGLFGTVIDMPRVALLFFLVALWGLNPYEPSVDPGRRGLDQ